MGFVQLLRQEYYWSSASLYNGNWARCMISSRDRFRAIMAFFRCNDHTAMDNDDKLRQVRYLIENVKQSCQDYFQCNKEVAVDERMVRSKHRSGIRQYNKDKPTKWGLKLWVLADSDTGYTYNFNVYLGKTRTRTSRKGLGYDVVIELTECLRHKVIMYILTISTPPLLF